MKTLAVEQLTGIRSRPSGLVATVLRRLVLRQLREITTGSLTITDGIEEVTLGEAEPDRCLRARISIHDERFWECLALGGSIGAGEAYMHGYWSADNLTNVVRVMCRNRHLHTRMDSGIRWLTRPVHFLTHLLRRNTLNGSRRNIAAHYDLGNEFFAEFLDPTMMYSCAIYPSAAATLEEASRHKIEHLCRKLDLRPQDHLLEIGTGWGALAIHAAQVYGCKVTTTTISARQYEMAIQRVRDAGLTDRVTVLREDYRNLRGTFDKVVSVEMIEAVGHEYFDTYFRQCSRLLTDNGLMVMQAITIADQNYDAARRGVDFIQKYIFPGGFLPSVTEICRSVTRASDMRLVHLEDITPHYARTLHDWHRNFLHNRDRILRQNFPEEFLRLWEFYFCYCEGGFLERVVGTVQVVLSKPLNRSEQTCGAPYAQEVPHGCH